MVVLMLLTIVASICVAWLQNIFGNDMPYWVLMISQGAISIGTFLVASFVGVFGVERKWCGHDFEWSFDMVYAIMGIVLITISGAIVEWASFANLQMLSWSQFEWLKSCDFSDNTLTIRMLSTITVAHTLAAIIVVVILPAVCEEFFFRGVVLRGMYASTGSGTLAVLSSAVFFSMLHMDVNGFLPRIVLGIVLGILFIQTRNIIYPIVAHAFNNGMVLYMCATSSEPIENILSAEPTNPGAFSPILSVVLFIWLAQFMNHYLGVKEAYKRLRRRK